MELIISIITAVLSFGLALFVYLKNPKSGTNVYFAGLIFFVGLYAILNYLAVQPTNDQTALFWTKLVIAVSAPQGPLFLWFVLTFPDSKFIFRLKLQIFMALWTILVIGLSFAGLVFATAKVSNGQIQLTPGPAIPAFGLLQFGSILVGFVVLIRKYLRSRGYLKQQLRYITYGIILSFSLMILATLVLPILFKITIFLNISPFFLAIAGSAIAFAIVRQKLFDIRAVVARSATYSLALIAVGLIYGFGTYVAGNFVINNTKSPELQMIVNVLLALMLAITYQPIRRFFQRVTDRVFYRDHYDAQELINEIGRILAAEIELDPLSNKVISEITRSLKVTDVNIIIYEDNEIIYDVHAGQHSPYLAEDLKLLGKNAIVADELSSGQRKEIMNRYKIGVSLALRTSKEFIGFLFLGEKLSGDIYTEADIKVLQIIANELAVGVQNAKAYSEIQQFNETLQAKVDDATKRLRHANEELKELDQAKDEFISMASHQLRTPLTTTKGYVSMVLEGDFGKPTRDMKEPLTQALDSANRMARMVSDLLNVSRMDAGKFFIDAHDSDLSKVVPEEVNGLQTLAGSRQVALTYHEPKHKIPTINLDEDKMRQVIMNLIDNSIHYSNATPGLGKTDVYLELDKKEVVFKVVDNGIGVPKAVQPKLFGKFFRAGNAQKTRPDGTGLGLYLVKRVVEDHGGKIIFESTEGKGSTFGFRMPLQTVIHNDPKAMKRLAAAQVSAGQ